jgi:hypothetical protein
MLKFLASLAALWGICWVTAFVAHARPLDWFFGPLDDAGTFLSLLVIGGMAGAVLYGVVSSLLERSKNLP